MRLFTAPWSVRTEPARRRAGGFSLAEIMVSLALMGLVMLGLHSVLRAAISYYRRSTTATEIQQACVLATSRLISEMLESNPTSIRGDSVNHLYVSFGSARDDQGNFSFGTDPSNPEDTRNRLIWQRYVGCYVAPQGEETALFRKERKIDPPVFLAPTIPEEFTETTWAQWPAPARLIAQRVYYLDVEPSTSVRVTLGVKSKDGDFAVSIETKLKPRN